ncbi:MAG: type IV secretion system DNA-binding domain-containing protein [Candidatus Krumholzibacteria bacterium]|nr:type IV secretion system DNA-binding domain-containing protein [Candidatus Krumholzibacteria bacterium]
MQPIEKTGSFYLGRTWDPATGKTTDEALMYDARDLTTHAVCVGMTGSGKTGLCIGLLEEAALDGVPAIIIDPKGDISNLLLTFPDLLPDDFEPWINPDDARRKGRDVPTHAAETARTWREGLASWGQDGERIKRLKAAAEFRIYTPGSSAGEPVSILASLAAPRQPWAGNEEMLRDQIRGVASAILGLAGSDADPIRSPEHIFFATVIEHYWRQGRSLDLADLIRALQEPPVRKLGVFDVDTFFPPQKRLGLAMELNGLLAAPGFAAWLEGTPLDIDNMLYTPDGRPRHAIFNIAHLDDAQRMFFVTLLLESTLAWTRRQSGTSSLRALLYMDELFGFMPPTANPPSKTPLLTLLKQARAFGLGVVLTTQNPVDLDYKGLSNTGTWFVGKLQTERDKARMMDGLESSGGWTDRGQLEKLISGLDSRVFLMHNVHDDAPTIFHTRWVMSYLCGPLTRDQIQRIQPPAPLLATAPSAQAANTAHSAAIAAAPGVVPTAGSSLTTDLQDEGYAPLAPALKASITQTFLPILTPAAAESSVLTYEPLLVGCGQVAFVDRRKGINGERRLGLQYDPGTPGMNVDWNKAEPLDLAPSELTANGRESALYAPLPRGWETVTLHRSAKAAFKDHLYRDQVLTVPAIPALKLYGEPDEDEATFLGRARLAVREKRDLEVDKLNRKMETKLERLEKKLGREERELAEDQAEHKSRKGQELLSAGETLLGMFGVLGRKRSTGLSTAARKRRMTSRAKEDIRESEQEIAALEGSLSDMRQQLADDVEAISDKWDAVLDEVETFDVSPRRTDVRLDIVGLAWAPVWLTPGADGGSHRQDAWRR